MSRFRSALTLCILAIAGSAQLEAAPLWELEGTSNQVRLLGSIHFLRPEDYPLPKLVEQSFDAADIIVMELDLGSVDPVTSLATIQRLAIDPNGESLSGALGPATWRRAERKAQAINIDLAALQPYEPWFAALQVTQLRLQQLGFDASYGLEAQLTRKAAGAGKTIRGLETMEEQLATLDSLPDSAQRIFLMETLDEAATADETLDGVISAWKAGDTSALEKEMLTSLKRQPEVYDRILVRRNRNWTSQIKALTRDKENYLIVVGTLHLVGEDSVLRMLEDAGLSSRQIR